MGEESVGRSGRSLLAGRAAEERPGAGHFIGATNAKPQRAAGGGPLARAFPDAVHPRRLDLRSAPAHRGRRTEGADRAAFEAALEYAKQREAFDPPIAKFQLIRSKLARMAMEIEGARALTIPEGTSEIHLSIIAKEIGI